MDCNFVTKPVIGFPNATSIRKSYWPSFFLREERLTGHQVDLASLLSNKTKRKTILEGYFQRYEYYKPYKSVIKNDWLYTKPRYKFKDDEICISVRAGDIWKNNSNEIIHPDYMALPFSYYKSIIESKSWSKIHIVTEDKDDLMVAKLVKDYQAVVHADSVEDDFNTLRSSMNIALSISTFSWWAAWLSDAHSIFMPRIGLFDPNTRPDINLVVDDEARYEYIPVESPSRWEGTEEQREWLLAN